MDIREVQTGLHSKSIFVIHEGQEYELVGVPLEAEATSYVAQHFNPAALPPNGRPLNEAEQRYQESRSGLEQLATLVDSLTGGWSELNAAARLETLRQAMLVLLRIARWLVVAQRSSI